MKLSKYLISLSILSFLFSNGSKAHDDLMSPINVDGKQVNPYLSGINQHSISNLELLYVCENVPKVTPPLSVINILRDPAEPSRVLVLKENFISSSISRRDARRCLNLHEYDISGFWGEAVYTNQISRETMVITSFDHQNRAASRRYKYCETVGGHSVFNLREMPVRSISNIWTENGPYYSSRIPYLNPYGILTPGYRCEKVSEESLFPDTEI